MCTMCPEVWYRKHVTTALVSVNSSINSPPGGV